MDKKALELFIQENPHLVKMRKFDNYPELSVLKYTKRVFYDNLWNDILVECRGTVVDDDLNVISRPFTKIYNLDIEDKAPKVPDDTMVTAYRKVNGFMVAMSWYKGQILVSTTGSLSGNFVDMAKEFIKLSFYEVMYENPNLTYIFECVHPNDQHIIQEQSGLYLIGIRDKSWCGTLYCDNLTEISQSLGCKAVESYRVSIAELRQMVSICNHEGFVAYTDDGRSFKIKSPFYLTSKWMARNPKTDKLMKDDFKQNIDEEYYPLLNNIRENIVSFTALSEQDRLSYIRDFLNR